MWPVYIVKIYIEMFMYSDNMSVLNVSKAVLKVYIC